MLGFRNLGNTCYMNSVMSVFLNSPNFIRLLETTKEKTEDVSEREKSAIQLLQSFRQIIDLKKTVEDSKFGVIQPRGIFRLMFDYLNLRKNNRIIPMQQNDAMECLSVYLDAFEEATSVKIENRWNNGYIQREIWRKSDDTKVDTKREQQIAWNISIPETKDPKAVVSLQDCISHTYETEEEIHYKRDEDKESQDYIIKRHLDSTPDIWIINLIRWNMKAQKIMTPVDIPLVMKQNGTLYYLRGIICHAGMSIPSGHYYSVVLDKDTKSDTHTIYRIDDEKIMKCPYPLPTIIQRHAYGIVYEKKAFS